MPDKRPIITLTTDFGEADYYVAAVKGVIRTLSPNAEIMDITHLIPPHDIYTTAFTLLCCYRDFPKDTIHLVIVDPGVGSQRRPILVSGGDYVFIGPDNGVFSYVYEQEDRCHVVHLTSEHYFRQPVSDTFHGRDIFAPCAAAIAKGVEPRMLGDEIDDPVRFNVPRPSAGSPRQVRGAVIHVDRFGNVITNITRAELTEEMTAGAFKIRIGKYEISRLLTHFAEAGQNELFAYFGSAGFLEVAVAKQPAAKLIEARLGMEVIIES
jgi:S-adenosyl-L-methionine hydrolase (adenosine-forming)